MTTYSPAEKWLRGPIGFALVSLLHVLVIYLLINGLERVKTLVNEEFRTTAYVDPITEHQIPDPDVLQRRDPAEPHKVIPIPAPPKTIDPVAEDTIDVVPEDPPANTPQTTGSAVTELPLIAPRVDERRPLVQPPYPSMAIRRDWQGRVLLRLRIGLDGRVLAVEILESSGYPVLDEAAVQTALRDWRLLPATRGDVAVEGIFATWVRFDLTDR